MVGSVGRNKGKWVEEVGTGKPSALGFTGSPLVPPPPLFLSPIWSIHWMCPNTFQVRKLELAGTFAE